MTDLPWYASFFGEDSIRLYSRYLTPERTEREILGILKHLQPRPGCRILDLACGTGRHAVPLAALGYQVTGLDLSPVMLRHGRATAEDVGVRVRWVQSDMRSIPFVDEFDAIFSVFLAFGYLETEVDDLQVLQQAHKALAPGGALLLETVGRDALLGHFVPAEIERFEDGLLVLQEQAFDCVTSRLSVRLTLIEPDGARREYTQSIRFYTLTELAAMLDVAGLRLEAYYGDLDGSDLRLDSRHLVILARKPGLTQPPSTLPPVAS